MGHDAGDQYLETCLLFAGELQDLLIEADNGGAQAEMRHGLIHLEKAFPDPRVDIFSIEANPIFVPTRAWVGTIAMAHAREEKEHGSCLDGNLMAFVGERAGSLRDVDQLVLVQYPPVARLERVTHWMMGEGIMALWRDELITDSGYRQPPLLVNRIISQILMLISRIVHIPFPVQV